MLDVVLVVIAVGFVAGVVVEVARRKREEAQLGRSSEESLRGTPSQEAPAATRGTLLDVSTPRITTDVVCAECGQSLEGMLSSDVVAIELDFQDAYRDEVFCSQAHAAAWLAKPLPPLPPMEFSTGRSHEGPDWGWIALVAGVLGVVGLALFGFYSLIRLIF